MQPANIPKVVFVLGAGSSHRLGFPLGNKLKDQLLTLLEPQNQLFGVLQVSGFKDTDISKFSRKLERAEFDTIDEHLREVNDPLTRDIGKRAMAYLIRMKESDHALFHRDNVARHWYKIFADHLAKYRDHVSPDQFSFITFNYDRSLPHYLYETLESRGAPPDMLRLFLGELNFHHVHGNVGELPWQLPSGHANAYHHYGTALSSADLATYTPRILLPDDKRDTGVFLARIVGPATIIVFVGFGFHEANMQFLPFDTLLPLSPDATERHFFSINPSAPPRGLMLGGKPIRHIGGEVEAVMRKFFSDLASGALLLPEKSPR